MTTATKKAPKKSASEKRAKAAPPAKDAKPAPEANGNGHAKPEKPLPTKEDRIKESYPRLAALEKQYAVAARELCTAEADLDDAREMVKLKQGNVDELNRKMHGVIDEIEHPEKYPLYQAKSLPNGNGKPAGEVKEDDTWRAVPIREAMPNLGKKVYDGMDGAKLETMGQYCDWRNKNQGANWVTDLPGVGKAAADKIDDALEAFLAKWRKEHPAKPVAPFDPLEVARAVKLVDVAFPKGSKANPVAYTEFLKLNTVGGVLDAAKKAQQSILDFLRGPQVGFTLIEADMAQDAMKKAGPAPAKPTEPLKAGNSSAPAGAPLVPTIHPKDIPAGVETVEQLEAAAKGKGEGK